MKEEGGSIYLSIYLSLGGYIEYYIQYVRAVTVVFDLQRTRKNLKFSEANEIMANLDENDNYFIRRFILCHCITFCITFQWRKSTSYE